MLICYFDQYFILFLLFQHPHKISTIFSNTTNLLPMWVWVYLHFAFSLNPRPLIQITLFFLSRVKRNTKLATDLT